MHDKSYFTLNPGQLDYKNIKNIFGNKVTVTLAEDAKKDVVYSAAKLHELIAQGQCIYGVNTGFGSLANVKISEEQLSKLQEKLVLSHAVGVGEPLPEEIVRLVIILKANALAQGYSGVRIEIIMFLLSLYNKEIYPYIPSKGSVGASGDLAPLAHLSLIFLNVGQIIYQNKLLPAAEGLKIAKLNPLKLAPKEGLALLNGTQVSTALALKGLFLAERLLRASIIIGALTNEAAMGSDIAFDKRIHAARKHTEQEDVASVFRQLLEGSIIRSSHLNCKKVQDPYSLRCQPQVLGACLAQLRFAGKVLLTEANGVTDNPLIFASDNEILSGGNFHAEFVAMASDNLALAIAEIGSLAERRIALMMDSNFSGLPAFLASNAGLDSGFMIAHVTASALASENKSLAHPASVDSIPTSANQEDHVSMATYAARRLTDMCENTANILAIELMVASQGVDMRAPLTSSPSLQIVIARFRQQVAFMDEDRYIAEDINISKRFILDGHLENSLDVDYFEKVGVN